MSSSLAARGSASLWLAALWAAAAVFFWPVLFGGMCFYFRDTLVYYYPQACVTASAWSHGRVPLWEPGIGAGYPFFADPHGVVFYPLSLLLALLPLPRSHCVLTVLHVPLAGTFLYLLLRRWRLSGAAAALGAAVLMFSGFTVTTTNLTIVLRGLCWAPAAMLAFEEFLDGGGARPLLTTALALAMQGLGTDPQHLVFTLGLLALQPLVRPERTRLPARRVLAGIAAAGGLAGLLAAVQLAGLAELFTQSARNVAVTREELTHYQVAPAQLLQTVLPLQFPDPASLAFPASFPDGDVPLYTDIHWGVAALALAAASLGWRHRQAGRRRVRNPAPHLPPLARTAAACAALAAAGLVLSLGDNLPFFGLFTTVLFPLRVFRYPSKYLFFTALAVPVMAAAGFQGLLDGHAGCRVWMRRALLAAGAAAALGLIAVRAGGDTLAASYLQRRLAAPGSSSWLAGHLADAWLVGAAEAAVLALVCLGLVWLCERGTAVGLPALGALAVASLAAATVNSYPIARDGYLSDPPRTASLLREADRPGPVAPPPRFMMRPPPVFQVLGEDPSSFLRMRLGRELMTQLRGVPFGCDLLLASPALRLASEARLTDWFSTAPPPVWDRLAAACGAGYSIEVESAETTALSSDVVGRAGAIVVRRTGSASPRAFIAARALGLPRGAELPGPQAVLEMPATVRYEAEGPEPETLAPACISRCELAAYASESLAVRFDLQGRGLLVVLDQFYPGWVARVDGVERPVVRVAGVFRGVPVRGGEHLLEMTYRSRSFAAGAVVSLLAWLATLAWIPMRRSAANT
ncbi:MAG: hypothetical protein HY303_04990 [Candidatus Wallbacteria bacterium]|nr:hypothetical protein [Candidatus Wallbacteria bacterium]